MHSFGESALRNDEACAECCSYNLKNGRHNGFFCSRECYLNYHFPKGNK